MKAGYYQFDVKYGDKDFNRGKVSETLKGLDFDLVVLPELFTTGYLFDSKEKAAEMAEAIPGGETTRVLANLAHEKQGFIIGTIPEIDEGKLYNTAVIAGPDGFVGKQRKIHLPAVERKIFEKGTFLRTFDLNGVPVGVMTCYDGWFPEAARYLTLQGAKILCLPANFGGTMTLSIMRARAIENMVYTITANRIGVENSPGITAHFRGESQVIDYNGEILIKADEGESVSIVDINPADSRKEGLVGTFDALMEELEFYRPHHVGNNQKKNPGITKPGLNIETTGNKI